MTFAKAVTFALEHGLIWLLVLAGLIAILWWAAAHDERDKYDDSNHHHW